MRINMKTISEDRVRQAMASGEFGDDVTGSAEKVVVIMTQDWCPQWVHMKTWLDNVETAGTVDIYPVEYNKEPYFNEFMAFKENTWKNGLVPYLRFYENGRLMKETNYINRIEFADLVG